MQASHYGSYLGWAALELHVVETLCGARLAHCYGGLIDEPQHARVVHLALDDLHGRDSLGSMVYGNTVDMRAARRARTTRRCSRRYLLVDIACQLHRPTGPRRQPGAADRGRADPERRGERRGAAARARARARGPPLRRPLRLARGSSASPPSSPSTRARFRDARARAARRRRRRRRRPGAAPARDAPATAMHELERRVAPARRRPPSRASSRGRRGSSRASPSGSAARCRALDGVRVVLAVLDVHDVVRDALARALPRAGCEVVLLPTDVSPGAIAAVAVAEDADAIVLGTYNGAALHDRPRAARRDRAGPAGTAQVIVGGRLNEDTGGELPVDVADDLRGLGFAPALEVEDAARLLATAGGARV